ncbi:hypothetical protein ACF0H5_013680 [Mactra antiquata]
MTTMYLNIPSLLILCTQMTLVYNSGHLFIGFLGYTNEFSSCCEDASCIDTTACNVTFEVMVEDLNSSTFPQYRRPSESSISLSVAKSFISDDITNPLSFNFNQWMGGANLTVYVYNGSSENVVDQFETEISLYGPRNYYIQKTLMDDSNNKSMLTLIFRYICDKTTGPACFTDCLDHDDNETCPVKPATTPSSVDVITFTFPDPPCETTDTDGNVILSNCSSTTSANNESTKSIDYVITTENTVTETTTTNEQTTTTIQPSRTTETTSKTTRKPSTPEHIVTVKSTNATKRNSEVDVSTKISTGITPSMKPPDGTGQSVDVNTAYWPAIVGGVLGGVALFAATAFICYWNRQKKLQKRQEIYNVNPKILRNFEEFEENGTSGRSDIAMETEQY